MCTGTGFAECEFTFRRPDGASVQIEIAVALCFGDQRVFGEDGFYSGCNRETDMFG
jgi:hypothetical protein